MFDQHVIKCCQIRLNLAFMIHEMVQMLLFFKSVKFVVKFGKLYHNLGKTKVGQDCYQFAEKVDFTVTLSSAQPRTNAAREAA